MPFAEDMSVFFNAAEFASAAVFTPYGGGAAQSGSVIFDSPTETLMSGEVLSDEFTMTYPASVLPGIRAGDTGTIDGVSYQVREIMFINDGRLKMARLTRL